MQHLTHTSFFRVTVVFTVLVFTVLAGPVLGSQQQPANERGFSPEKSYQFGDLDNINLFNGNLVLTIPLGQRFHINGSFGYQLQLIYNAKAWDWQYYEHNGQASNVPTPSWESNAGLGWTQTLGELIPPSTFPLNPRNETDKWLYIAADGGEHYFYPTLHPSDTNAIAGIFYTRDGSYLRLRQVGGLRQVHYPDGTSHEFPNIGGRVTRIADLFGNDLTITYTNTLWTLDDGHREHTITFVEKTVDDMDDNKRYLVKTVDLAAFGGETATYTFRYAQRPIERPCPYSPVAGHPKGPTATLQVLNRIDLPEGSSYGMQGGYLLTRLPDDGNGSCAASGALEKIKLPTLGEIHYRYGGYRFPSGNRPDCGEPSGPNIPGPPGCIPEFATVSAGVYERALHLPGASTAIGTWTYTPRVTNEGSNAAVEITNTVVDASNTRTVHYFSAYNGGGNTVGATVGEYGLPYTRKASNGGRYLSKRVYQRSGSLFESTFVGYERDAGGLAIPDEYGEHLHVNHRLARQRQVHHTDGGKRVDRAGRHGHDLRIQQRRRCARPGTHHPDESGRHLGRRR